LSSLPLIGATGIPSIYYKDQQAADMALERFDKDNPQCQVWTNWQKMCSRIGKSTYCTVDKLNPVKPSTVFCAEGDESEKLLERSSELRFCTKKIDVTHLDEKHSVCVRFSPNRPFGGRNIIPRLSPGCNEWKTEVSNKRACLEVRHNKVPDCEKQSGVIEHSREGYYCAQFSRSGCFDMSVREQNARDSVIDDVSILKRVDRSQDGNPVHGLFCGEKK
jgi:hypothetical protein